MVDYTDRQVQLAKEIVQTLLSGGQFPPELPIADIEYNAVLFLTELEKLGGCSAIEAPGGPPIPVSLSMLGPHAFERPLEIRRDRLSREYRDWPQEMLRIRGRPRIEGRWLSYWDAHESFSIRASEFLTIRLAGVGSGIRRYLSLPFVLGGRRAQVPGCEFSVFTRTSGLTAYWTGAYYISSNYLGAPTSPAVGTILAGTYVFGVNGGSYGNQIKWHKKAVCSVPGVTEIHLPY